MTGQGDYVGRVRIERPLGEGGMGQVFAGFDEVLERRVAIKTLRHRRAYDGVARARFQREARILSRLDHPGICRLYDLIEGEDRDYLVLELVDGRTLAELLVDGIDDGEKLRLAEGVASALAAAHAAQVVHRDLKPENVMVTPQGEVKVLDFGVARTTEASDEAVDEEDRRLLGHGDGELEATLAAGLPAAPANGSGPSRSGSHHASRSDVATRLGEIVGTVRYMSPEQAQGQAVTPASDVYSFGIVLQEMVTGRRAYPRKRSQLEKLQQVAEAATVPPVGVTPALARLIRDLTRLDPAARPTAAGAAARLRQIRSSPERRRRRRQGLAAATAVALLLAATALAGRWLAEEPLLAGDQAPRLVLFPFVNATGEPQLDWVEHGLMKIVAETLDATPGIDVVDPATVEKAAARLDLDAGEPAEEIVRFTRAAGAQLAITTRVRRGSDGVVLAYATYNVNGSRGRREVTAAEPTRAAELLSRRLERRLKPDAPRVEVSDQFSADPLVNQLFAMGVQRFEQGAPAEAEAYYRVCLDLEPDFARAGVALAKSLLEQGEWDAAASEAERLLAASSESEQPRLVAAIREVQSWILYRRGDLAAARALHEGTLTLYRRLEDREGEALALRRLASISIDEGDLQTARRLAEAALAIRRQLGDEIGTATGLHTLGILSAREGDREGARRLFEEELELCRRSGNVVDVARTLNSLGVLAADAHDWPTARAHYEEAIATYRRAGVTPSLSLTLSNLGYVAVSQGLPEEAEEHLREAFALADGIDFVEGRALAALNLLQLLTLGGDLGEAAPYAPIARDHYGDVWEITFYEALQAAADGRTDPARRLLAKAREGAGADWTEQEERAVAQYGL